MLNSDYDKYKQTVSRFLNDDSQRVLVIRGDWGAGKTYFWNDVLYSDASFTETSLYKYAYTSLFGVESLSEFKVTLSRSKKFLRTDIRSRFVKDWRRRSGFYDKSKLVILNTWYFICWVFSWLISFIEKVPIINLFSYAINQLSFHTLNNTVICIDDIERRGDGLDIKSVCGVVEILKSEKKCKVILIINDQEEASGAKDAVKNNLEKISDANILFHLSPVEYISKVCDFELDEDEKHTFYNALSILEIKNIRAAEKAFKYYQSVVDASYENKENIKSYIIHEICLLCWVKYCSDSPNAGYIEELKRKSFYSIDDDGLNANDKKLLTRVDKLNLLSDRSELKSLLSKMVYTGYFDTKDFYLAIDDFSKIGNQETSHIHNSIMFAMQGFKDNSEEAIDMLVSSISDLKTPVTLNNFNSVIDLLEEIEADFDLDKIVDNYIKVKRDDLVDLLVTGETKELFDRDRLNSTLLIKIDEVVEEYIRDTPPEYALSNLLAGEWRSNKNTSLIVNKCDYECIGNFILENITHEDDILKLMDISIEVQRFTLDDSFQIALTAFLKDRASISPLNRYRLLKVMNRLYEYENRGITAD